MQCVGVCSDMVKKSGGMVEKTAVRGCVRWHGVFSRSC